AGRAARADQEPRRPPAAGQCGPRPGPASDARDRQSYGPDPETLGGRADAAVERGGAFRQTRDAVPGHVALLSGRRSPTTALDDVKYLEAFVKVEDQGTFNEPMYMTARWRKQEGEWREFICAENNQDHYGHNLFPLPEAKKPDF